MKKEMLINVLQSEECRIAIVEDGILEELYVERASHENYTGNIYKGRVVNLEPAIQAAFVDFSVGRNGFLHVSDVDPLYYARAMAEESEFAAKPRDQRKSRDRDDYQDDPRAGRERGGNRDRGGDRGAAAPPPQHQHQPPPPPQARGYYEDRPKSRDRDDRGERESRHDQDRDRDRGRRERPDRMDRFRKRSAPSNARSFGEGLSEEESARDREREREREHHARQRDWDREFDAEPESPRDRGHWAGYPAPPASVAPPPSAPTAPSAPAQRPAIYARDEPPARFVRSHSEPAAPTAPAPAPLLDIEPELPPSRTNRSRAAATSHPVAPAPEAAPPASAPPAREAKRPRNRRSSKRAPVEAEPESPAFEAVDDFAGPIRGYADFDEPIEAPRHIEPAPAPDPAPILSAPAFYEDAEFDPEPAPPSEIEPEIEISGRRSGRDAIRARGGERGQRNRDRDKDRDRGRGRDRDRAPEAPPAAAPAPSYHHDRDPGERVRDWETRPAAPVAPSSPPTPAALPPRAAAPAPAPAPAPAEFEARPRGRGQHGRAGEPGYVPRRERYPSAAGAPIEEAATAWTEEQPAAGDDFDNGDFEGDSADAASSAKQRRRRRRRRQREHERGPRRHPEGGETLPAGQDYADSDLDDDLDNEIDGEEFVPQLPTNRRPPSVAPALAPSPSPAVSAPTPTPSPAPTPAPAPYPYPPAAPASYPPAASSSAPSKRQRRDAVPDDDEFAADGDDYPADDFDFDESGRYSDVLTDDEDEEETAKIDDDDRLDPELVEEIRREIEEIAELEIEMGMRGGVEMKGRRGEMLAGAAASFRPRPNVKPLIQDIFRRGDEVLVQVIKESIGTKGPTLSTYISIPGRYLVLMPGLNRVGVSRKITDEPERRRLRQIMTELNPPKNLGFIVRTAGIDRTKHELGRDLAYLLRLWKAILRRIKRTRAPGVIYQESDMIIRTIRDIFSSDIDTIWIDEPQAFEHAQDFLRNVMPRYVDRLKLYDGKAPLFHKYGLEEEIQKIHRKTVPLQGGGSIVIEPTEALVAIDVNSGNFRVENDAEKTAYETNLRAAKEISRQLRLRDLGGVIINDFIDMRDERHRRGVERAMREAIRRDRARTKVLRMSSFGIVEMTRQRIRPSLKKSVYEDCPHCQASGVVKTAESMAIEVMRMLQVAANRPENRRVNITVSAPVANYLNNLKRREIGQIEAEANIKIYIRAENDCAGDFLQVDCYDANNAEVRVFSSAPAPTNPAKRNNPL